jgi:hypothetical protein
MQQSTVTAVLCLLSYDYLHRLVPHKYNKPASVKAITSEIETAITDLYPTARVQVETTPDQAAPYYLYLVTHTPHASTAAEMVTMHERALLDAHKWLSIAITEQLASDSWFRQ